MLEDRKKETSIKMNIYIIRSSLNRKKKEFEIKKKTQKIPQKEEHNSGDPDRSKIDKQRMRDRAVHRDEKRI